MTVLLATNLSTGETLSAPDAISARAWLFELDWSALSDWRIATVSCPGCAAPIDPSGCRPYPTDDPFADDANVEPFWCSSCGGQCPIASGVLDPACSYVLGLAYGLGAAQDPADPAHSDDYLVSEAVELELEEHGCTLLLPAATDYCQDPAVIAAYRLGLSSNT